MAEITRDVRFLFVMRDPTSRAASHLRHLRRRVNKDESLDALLDRVGPRDPVYICSDYAYTIRTLRALGLEDRCKFLLYEGLFKQETMDHLCTWLGLPLHQAVFEKRLNPGVGDSLTETQLDLLRSRLSPIYDQLRDDPAVQAASSWRW